MMLTLLSFTVLPEASAATTAPSWAIGDSWTYVGSGVTRLVDAQPPVGTHRFIVLGTDTIAEAGASVPVFHLQDLWNGTNETPSVAMDAWYRQSDLAMVRVRETSEVCNLYPPFTCANITVTQTADPPLPRDFPLTAGESWSAQTTLTTERQDLDNGSVGWANYTVWENASVAADVAVVVPAGNFTVTPLTENYSGIGLVLNPYGWTYVVRDFSPSVGNVVEERDYGLTHVPGAGLVQAAELRLVSYSLVPWYALPVLGVPLWAWLVGAAAIVVGVTVVAVRRRRNASSRIPPAAEAPTRPQEPPKGSG